MHPHHTTTNPAANTNQKHEPQADILEHREEQVKGAEARCGELASQLERLRGDLTTCNEDIKKLKVSFGVDMI